MNVYRSLLLLLLLLLLPRRLPQLLLPWLLLLRRLLLLWPFLWLLRAMLGLLLLRAMLGFLLLLLLPSTWRRPRLPSARLQPGEGDRLLAPWLRLPLRRRP